MFLRCLLLFTLAANAFAADIAIGQGAPTDAIRQRFVTNYYRGRFSSITSLPALTTVNTFGGTGYVQEFPDLTKNGGIRHALIIGNTIVDNEGFFIDTYQVFSPIYVYYLSGGLGFANLGFPISDTDIVEIKDSTGAVTLKGPASATTEI